MLTSDTKIPRATKNTLVNWHVGGHHMRDQQKREQGWHTVQLFMSAFLAMVLGQL